MKLVNNLKGAHPARVVSDLRDLFSSNAERFADKIAYYYFLPDGSQATLTYSEIFRNMNRFGTALYRLGLKQKRVVITGDQHPFWFTAFISVINGGGVSVPMDKDLTEEEFVRFVDWSGAEAVVYTAHFNGRMPALADRMKNVRILIPIEPCEDDLADPRVKSFEELLGLGARELENGFTEYLDYEIELDRFCALLFTSGTTGTAKGVMLSHKNLTAATNASCQSMSYDFNNRFVSMLPPFHTYEITCGQFAILNLGASILINDSLKHIMKNFREFRPNALMLVPRVVEMMHRRVWDEIKKRGMEKKVRTAMALNKPLLAAGIDVRKKLFGKITEAFGGELKSIVCGGAPIAPEIIKDFYQFGITVLEGYGITECSPLVAVNSPGEVRFHSVGTPVRGCQVKIDTDGDGSTGEILVKGDNVMMGYYENDEANAAAFTEDGWFRTGDVGYTDKNGYIYITGRKKNVIILSNGKNVFPEELEEYLYANPEIAEAVVVADEIETGKTVLTALIVPSNEILKLDDGAILEHYKPFLIELNKKLPSYKQIHNVKIRREEFEKTTTLKIMRHRIAKNDE